MARLIVAAAAAAVALAALMAAAALVYFEPFPRLGYSKQRSAEVFTDCHACPQMLPIPAGTFIMGDQQPRRREVWLGWLHLSGEPSPRRTVTIEAQFAMGVTEVTFAQWDACVADGGCRGYAPPDEGWGREDRPVIHVSWNDAQAYVRWLSETTGQTYRLPTEAEWEYAARSGSGANYPWGRHPGPGWANYGAPDCPPCTGAEAGRDRWLRTAPAAQFPPNGFGLYDMIGNVYEWVEDCYVGYLPTQEATGEAIVSGDCGMRMMRGGTWYSASTQIRSYYRTRNPADWEDWVIGFRVARSM